jgi:ATP-dependent Clp protease, protease subunit
MLNERPMTRDSGVVQPHYQMPSYQRTRELTLDDMLLENRVVFMIGEISYRMSTEVIMKLIYLEHLKKGTDINLYINSPGGSVSDTMAIYDTIQFINSPVVTTCIGMAASGAAVILASGAEGKRFALPHAKIMLHQPWGGVTGQAADVQIQAEEIIRSRKNINEILSKHTKQPMEKILAETLRDRYMTAEEALAYGLIDEVLLQQEDAGKSKK